MADGIVSVPNTGSAKVDTEELTVGANTVERQRIQIAGSAAAAIAAILNSAPSTEYGIVTRNIPSGTQAVSGTVTSNIGTTNGLALDATLTGGSLRSKITDGTNNAAVKAASTAAAATDPALVVAISPNNSVAVTGTFWQATQPVSGTVTANAGSGTFNTQDAADLVDNAGFTDGTSKVLPAGYILDDVAGTALTENDVAAARIDSKRAQVFVLEDATTRGQKATVSAAGAVKVDGSAVTQPISAASLPLPTNAAQEHTTAGSPSSVRLSDGTSFYDSTKTGQLPSALDGSGFLKVHEQGVATQKPDVVAATTAAWTSATGIDTTISIATTNYNTALVTINPTTTFTGGAIVFEASDDAGTTWYPVYGTRTDGSAIENSYTIVASTKRIWQINVAGATNVRVRLNPAITGTGTLNVRLQASAAVAQPMTAAKMGDGTTVLRVMPAGIGATASDPSIGIQWNPTSPDATTNLKQIASTNVATNNGTADGGTQRVVIASNNTAFNVNVLQSTAGNLNGLMAQAASQTNNAGSWWMKIADGTNGPAAVKAASTVPAATDPALVVTQRPGDIQDTTAAATALGALNATVSIALAGQEGCGCTITAISSPTGIVLTPEVSYDGGTNYVASVFFEVGTGRVFATLDNTRPAAFAAGQAYTIQTPTGVSHARVRATSWTSGSVTVSMRASFNDATFVTTRDQTSTTYTATYMLAATSSIALSNAFAGAGQKQFATIYHPSTALRNVRIKRVTIAFVSASAAALVSAYIQRLTSTTAPATGAPDVTPIAHNSGAAVAEANCRALPGTAGSTGSAGVDICGATELNLGVTGTSTAQPVPPEIVLYDDSQGTNLEPLIIRKGVAEGYTVWVGCSAAATVKAIIRITFVEE